MERIWCILIGYAFGCINTGYLLGRWVKGIDLRQYGSHNAGASNALRVMGTKLGVICLLGDVLKGVLALIVVSLIFGYDNKHFLLFAGLGAVVGHNFPFYLGFKGGKGVAVTLGILLLMDWRCFLIAGIPSLIVLILTRYTSLFSIDFVTIFPISTFVFYLDAPHGWEVITLSLCFTAIIAWRHHENISRLMKNTERRVGERVFIHAEDED